MLRRACDAISGAAMVVDLSPRELNSQSCFREKQQLSALVSKTFVKAVIQKMTRVQCEQLLLFLMDNHTQPFYLNIVS